MKLIEKIQKYIVNYKTKQEGGYPFSSTIRQYYLKKYNITIGYGTYGGCFNIKNIPAGTVFGNYCSVADGVKIFRANHPIEQFTMHPILYNPKMGFVKNDMLQRPKLYIGHDVWFGANCLIMPSVNSIGSGSIIAAGSVVTKDVEPYTIVAGNPSKVIKKRFDESIIMKLESTKWWELRKEELVLKIELIKKLTNG